MGRVCRLGVRRDRSHWVRRFPARLFPGFERVAAKRWEEAGAPITFPIKEQDRGQTTFNTASLSHALEGDLRTLPNVSGAMVGLFGTAPEIELRSVLDVTDRIDPQGLPQKFDQAVERFEVPCDFAGPDSGDSAVPRKAAGATTGVDAWQIGGQSWSKLPKSPVRTPAPIYRKRAIRSVGGEIALIRGLDAIGVKRPMSRR